MNKNSREVVLIVLIIPIVFIVALIIPVVNPIIIIIMVTLTIQLNTISTVTTVILLIIQLWHFHYSMKELMLKQLQQYLINLLLRFVVVHRIHEYPWILVIGEGTP